VTQQKNAVAHVNTLALATVVALGGMVSEVSFAQSGARGGLEEIIVVAQRREQSLQDVPIAISALDAGSLEKLGISNAMDLRMSTPGLNFTQRAGASLASIRGVSTPNTAPGSEASIAMYVDGVYYPSVSSNVFNLQNIERVEVLKGPQGTLFGRNATGGLIHVITKKPTDEFEGSASVGYGRYGTLAAKAHVSGGTENLAANFSIHSNTQEDGYGKNLTTGKDVYIHEEFGMRTRMVWNISDASELDISADWTRKDGDMGRARTVYPGSRLLDGNTTTGGFDTVQNWDGDTRTDDHWGVSVKYTHQFDNVTFSSLTAYRDFRMGRQFDTDVSTLQAVNAITQEETLSLQQEFLLVGEIGDLHWTAGVIAMDIETGYDPLVLRSDSFLTQNVDSWGLQDTRSYAAFAEGTYALSPNTNLTLGLRYTVDDKEQDGKVVTAVGHPMGADIVLVTAQNSFKSEDPTWRLAIDHKLNDDHMVFASYSRGFKSGAYNPSAITHAPVRPEYLDAYEIGIKSEFLDNRLRTSASLFYYDYQDVQAFINMQGTTTAINAADAEIIGFDAEALYFMEVGDGTLDLRAGLSILDSEYKKFPEGIEMRPNPAPNGGNSAIPADLSGKTMIQTPDYTFNLGIDYSVPMGEGTYGASLNYYYNDGFFWEADNRIVQESYQVINARINYVFGGAGDKYEVWLKGNNLTDERYVDYAQSATGGDLISYAAPRIWEVGVGVKF